MARTWNLRMNLDEFNALLASLYTDGDRALALQGLALGMNSGACPESVPDAFRRAWELGNGMRGEADEFRAAQAERGKSSAAKRLERTGSAQPQKLAAVRTGPEPPFEPPFEPGLEPPPEPNHNPQSTIQETTNNNLPPPAPQGGDPHVVRALDAWNEGIQGTNLPRARITTKRAKVIATRIRESGWMEDFRMAVRAVAGSQFHRGGNDRGWIADIDYLLQAGKATQIAEKADAAPVQGSRRLSDPPRPITYTPGDLNGIDMDAVSRL